jgi:hypothetical protein
MKDINQYRGTKTAINCRTQQEWDRITELLGYVWEACEWGDYSESNCIKCKTKGASYIDFYKEQGYTILPASDFLEPNTTMQPKGILTDEDGLKWEVKHGRIAGEPMGGTYPSGIYLEPHIERKPLFTEAIKPPLGLMPKGIYEERERTRRFDDICRVISEYYDAGLKINPEWVTEYNELLEYFTPKQ